MVGEPAVANRRRVPARTCPGRPTSSGTGSPDAVVTLALSGPVWTSALPSPRLRCRLFPVMDEAATPWCPLGASSPCTSSRAGTTRWVTPQAWPWQHGAPERRPNAAAPGPVGAGGAEGSLVAAVVAGGGGVCPRRLRMARDEARCAWATTSTSSPTCSATGQSADHRPGVAPGRRRGASQMFSAALRTHPLSRPGLLLTADRPGESSGARTHCCLHPQSRDGGWPPIQ